ncbi:MAG: hypothetical protein PHE54_04680 [Bacilli bacterium]|nr:hypothetical protein [Bacilli bacterium]
MNYKFKIITIMAITLLITGCSVDYNLVITEKREVKESTIIEISKESLADLDMTADEFIDSKIQSYKSYSQFNEYEISKKFSLNNAVMRIKRNFTSLEDYVGSVLYYKVFESGNISEEDDTLTFETTGDYNYNNFFYNSLDLNSQIPTININIRFYNEVLDSNADKVNTFTNTYTWYISPDDINEKQITFTINNKIKYDIIIIDFLINYMIEIVSGIIVISILILGILLFKRMHKKNNEI